METSKKLACAVFAVTAIAGVLVAIAHYPQTHDSNVGLFTVQKKAYQFRFSKFTQGKSHVIFNGNPVLARLKWAICQTPFAPLSRLVPRSILSEWSSCTTPTNATVLWVGWTHRDYSYNLTNGVPYPSRFDLDQLDCFLSEPRGQITKLNHLYGSDAPFAKQLVRGWVMPTNLTNRVGCTLHLREYRDYKEKDIATIQLK
jgi:hypothetical protein